MTKWMNGWRAACLGRAGRAGQGTPGGRNTVVGGMGCHLRLHDLAAGFQSAAGNKFKAVFAANVMAKVSRRHRRHRGLDPPVNRRPHQ